MIWTDLRYSTRSLVRSPGLTSTLLLTIALGIGSNAAIFGFIRGFSAPAVTAPESTQFMSTAMSRISMLLTSAAWGVFVVACVNVATLLLSRSSARTRDSSVRMALGASRGQMVRQLLGEAVLLSLGGAAIGVLLASWTTRVVPALLFEQDAEQLVLIPDFFTTITAAFGCAAIMIVCSLVPLAEIRQDDSARVLRRESAGPSLPMRRVRAALVIVQMTCCCLLVVSAAILITGFRGALRTQAGQQLKSAILATVESQKRFQRPDLGFEYFHAIEEAAQAMPQTITTAWSGMPPGARPGSQSVRIVPAHASRRDATLDLAPFTRQSLDAVVLPPVGGRMFGAGDTAATCRVVVVNDVAADVLGGKVVGETIQDFAGQRAEIIGVVAARPTEGKTPVRPTIYYYPDQESISPDLLGPTRFRVPADVSHPSVVIETQVVSSTYVDVMGLTIAAGTTFPNAPGRSCRIGLVNQEASERYFAGDAVGGAIIDGSGHRTDIIGVLQSSVLRASQRQIEPAIYLPMTQDFLPRMTLIIASRDAKAETVAALRRRLDAIPGGRSSAVVTTLEEHLSRVALAPERIAMVLVGASAAMAVLLGGLGLYGAMVDAARQRRREFGVRIALGSQSWRLVGQVLREGARLAAAGTIAGLLLSRIVAQWLLQITPTVEPTPLWVWLAAPTTLLVAVLIASVLPARIALATDPLTVMRDQ